MIFFLPFSFHTSFWLTFFSLFFLLEQMNGARRMGGRTDRHAGYEMIRNEMLYLIDSVMMIPHHRSIAGDFTSWRADWTYPRLVQYCVFV